MTRQTRQNIRSLVGIFALGSVAALGAWYLNRTDATFFNFTRANSADVRAFPGAMGFGANTPGGRGGRVISVTNLNDSGDGSLRAAIEATGPRIIVFKVGGVITAQSPLVIKNPFVTIAGQTAPGKGIVVAGAPLEVQTNNVIVRGMRLRVGDAPGYTPVNRDGTKASGYDDRAVYNVVFDHNSISWAVDENTSTWDNSSTDNKVYDITYSWNIISEGLLCSIHPEVQSQTCATNKYPHSMGMILGNYNQNITVHNNLFASNGERNPLITSGTTTEIVNNVVYNWRSGPTVVAGNSGTKPLFSNIIGNYYKATAGSFVRQNNKHGIFIRCSTPSGSKVFVQGNVGPGRPTDSGDEWAAVLLDSGCDLSSVKSAGSALTTKSNVTATTADQAYQNVLAKAGAINPVRDDVDNRVVKYVQDGTQPVAGKWFVDSQSEVGGWTSYPSVTTDVPDTDNDGIDDRWESLRGGNLDPNAVSPTGYTWIEDYINGFISGQPPITSAPSPSPVVTPSPKESPIPSVVPSPSPTPQPTTSPRPSASPVIDVPPPSVTLTYPSNGVQLRTNTVFKLAAQASSTVGISKVEFLVNNVVICTDTAAAYDCRWRSPRVSGQTIVITAKAYDKLGVSNTSSVTVSTR